MTPEDSTEKSTLPLLDWLLQKHPDTPRKRAKQWILAGRVSVNGVIIRQPNKTIPDPADGLELLGRNATALDCGRDGWPIHPRVAILHLDTALAVVNKGPGLLSVPADPDDLSALSILADFLSGKLRARDRDVAGRSLPPAYRQLEPLPVHRLDQYTSGVFCMAMNPAARQNLIDQLSAHTMKREYVAYVEGRPPRPTGTWRNWLKLGPDELRQFVVSEREAKRSQTEAVEAITHYEVIEEFPLAGSQQFVTKLRLRLETGRKHQIRAQAAHAGLPLVGDRTYHPKYRADAPKKPRLEFPRQALHAEALSLDHPDKPANDFGAGKPHTRMTWTAALPRDLRQLEGALRKERT
ncbi:MAG TPA: RluA family pseudouridine synthase [Verrucomicrobiae bacterium]|nr:RluA family pseudouridine synthase [Verrucomicrobiae bacterium]